MDKKSGKFTLILKIIKKHVIRKITKGKKQKVIENYGKKL